MGDNFNGVDPLEFLLQPVQEEFVNQPVQSDNDQKWAFFE